MAKSRKINSKRVSASKDSADRQPLRGIEKVAWWSVPMVAAVALGCVTTLGILLVTQPVSSVKNPSMVVQSPAENIEPTVDSKTTLVVQTSTERDLEVQREPEVVPAPAPALPSIADSAPPEEIIAAEKPAAAGPQTPVSVSVSATSLMSLQCSKGKISFEGPGDVKFVDAQPAMEITEDGGVEFANLFFNGTDSSAELPPIAKDQGSLLIVAKMPARKTSIFLDSSYQRLTLRKNRDGLRWRIAGVQKPAKIRLVAKQVDFDQWHHIVVTWKAGNDAILFVDGEEHDRYAYANEQPHFPNYEDIVLGRTRGPNAQYYECRVHKLVVYDRPLPMEDVAKLNQSVRQTYPFIFK